MAKWMEDEDIKLKDGYKQGGKDVMQLPRWFRSNKNCAPE
jgi:hypothetical protein